MLGRFWINFFMYTLPRASFYYRHMDFTLNAWRIILSLSNCMSSDSVINLFDRCGKFSMFLPSRTDIDLRNRLFSRVLPPLLEIGCLDEFWSNSIGQMATTALIFCMELCCLHDRVLSLMVGKVLLTAEASVCRVDAVAYPHSLSLRLKKGRTHSSSKSGTLSSSSFSMEIWETVYSRENLESGWECRLDSGDPMAFRVS